MTGCTLVQPKKIVRDYENRENFASPSTSGTLSPWREVGPPSEQIGHNGGIQDFLAEGGQPDTSTVFIGPNCLSTNADISMGWGTHLAVWKVIVNGVG